MKYVYYSHSLPKNISSALESGTFPRSLEIMASISSYSSDEDYHKYEADSEAVLEDSTDEYDSDYDPERDVGDCETDRVSNEHF